jgi:hypothetical protein
MSCQCLIRVRVIVVLIPYAYRACCNHKHPKALNHGDLLSVDQIEDKWSKTDCCCQQRNDDAFVDFCKLSVLKTTSDRNKEQEMVQSSQQHSVLSHPIALVKRRILPVHVSVSKPNQSIAKSQHKHPLNSICPHDIAHKVIASTISKTGSERVLEPVAFSVLTFVHYTSLC